MRRIKNELPGICARIIGWRQSESGDAPLRPPMPDSPSIAAIRREPLAAITHAGHPRSASGPSLNVTPAISATAHTFTASRNADIHGDCRRRNKTGASRGYIKERRQKNRDRGHGGSRYPSQNVSDEGCGREHRTRRELADCDRVQQLQVREPGTLLNRSLFEEGQQYVSAAVEHRAHL